MSSDGTRRRSEPADVLLVDDNTLDERALRNAVAKLPSAARIHTVTSGQAALDVLNIQDNPDRPRDGGPGDGRTRTTDQPPNFRPELVLLDLNLPGKTGHEVLTEIRMNDHVRLLPVVILSTSDDHTDIENAYSLGANAYVIKPADLDGWLQVMATINDFWLSIATLPR